MRTMIAAALIGVSLLAACGGGSNIAPGPPVTGAAANVQPITVDAGPVALPNPDVNTLFTTVTVCMPGSTTSCQTIDHVQVDTGSSGLRILASALTLNLPQQIDGSGHAILECTQFVDGFSWGPVRTADVQISGELAPAIAIQVIGDTAYPTVPTDCSSSGTAENTVQTFGANGILGVGPFISDCGSGCTAVPNPIYYACTSSSTCQNAAMAVAQQVSNPVAFFATDNNGVIVELPAVSANGAASVSGSLVFGIGTQANNGLGAATVFTVSTADGSLTTQYGGNALTLSFIDSGSNAYYFPDSTIKVCDNTTLAPGFFCPAATLNLSATIQGVNGTSSLVDFNIANADTLFRMNGAIAAAGALGSSSTTTMSGSFDGTNSFDWGLPFYFGRNVVTAIETRNTVGGEGPYFAF